MTRRNSQGGAPRVSRRAVLRGLGATVALPFLPSLVSKATTCPASRVVGAPAGIVPEYSRVVPSKLP